MKRFNRLDFATIDFFHFGWAYALKPKFQGSLKLITETRKCFLLIINIIVIQKHFTIPVEL